MRVSYKKEGYRRAVADVDFCCRQMEDHWLNDIMFDSLWKCARLKTNLEPRIDHCPFCGRRIAVKEDKHD